QRGPFPRPGTVGTVPDGWDVKLAEDGEVLVRSRDLFEGYWNDPATTEALKADDGYWHTGDVGEWRDGNLRLVDRARDFIVTGGVVALIGAEIGKANAELARVEQVKTFRILPKALDPEEENEPVTPTRKVKRTLMAERFKPLVDAMYDDSESRLLAGEVRDALS